MSRFEPIVLPTGRYALTAATDDAIRGGCGAPARVGQAAHPIMAFIAAVGGLGASVAEVCRLCGSSVDVGPVLASCAIRYPREMRIDQEYRVEARLADVARKPSHRFGAADHARLEIALMQGEDIHAEVSLHWILPVRGEA
jgi:hypothetical protein